MSRRTFRNLAFIPMVVTIALTFFTVYGRALTLDEVKDVIAGTVALPASARIEKISRKFVGSPYLLGPLGEGTHGVYNRNPLYRFDAFDCTTFVETVISLATAKDFAGFEMNMNKIRYQGGVVSYVLRNHFPETDWIPNNEAAGIIHDGTVDLVDAQKASGATPVGLSWAQALIDKPAWYIHHTLTDIVVPGSTSLQRQELLTRLRLEGRQFKAELNSLPYVSLKTIFGTPQGLRFLAEIPSGSVINIVRPNWDLTATQGTHLNISHQGFAVRERGQLYFRHASGSGSVVTIPLDAYLRQFLNSATIKGININLVVK